MFSFALIALAIAFSALAAPAPTYPGPSASFTAGGQCNVEWTADQTGTWTTMNIELMTGPNEQMIHMRTVATVNAATQTSFSWICPEVNPYAPIYFYQFSSPVDPKNLLWVTRFLIKDTNGSSVPAPLTDPNGIAYGLGEFVDPSEYNPMPTYLVGNGQVQGGPTNGTTYTTPGSGVPSSTGSVSTPTGSSTGTFIGSGSLTQSTTTSPATSSTQTSTSPAKSGGALSSVSSSWMTLLSAIVAGVFVLSN